MSVSPTARLPSTPTAESPNRSAFFRELGGSWAMFLRESKIPFADSSFPRASGLLQKEEVLDTSITKSKKQMQAIDQQPHLLRGVLQHEFLRLNKLRDHALSRSALPLSRAAPTGFSRCSRSRVGRAHYGTHRMPLRRRRPEKKKNHQEKTTTQKGTKPYSPVTTPSRGGAPLPSLHRFDGWFICRPLLDIGRRPTRRRTYKQDTTAIKQGSNGKFKTKYKTKEVRYTLESVCAKGTSSGSGGLL